MEETLMGALPEYQSHKRVRALKIKLCVFDGTGWYLQPVDERYGPIRISDDWMNKHSDGGIRNLEGGYYIQYSDGYKSWSPAEVFEHGHTLVPPKRSPSNRLMRWLDSSHLPLHLSVIAQPIQAAGEILDSMLDEGPEKMAGIRKLIEAKDCLVRARLEMGS